MGTRCPNATSEEGPEAAPVTETGAKGSLQEDTGLLHTLAPTQGPGVELLPNALTSALRMEEEKTGKNLGATASRGPDQASPVALPSRKGKKF